MKKYGLIFLVFLFLCSCSCPKQLAKLRYKCPELFYTDTVTKTVIIPEYKYDTTYSFPPGYRWQTPFLNPLVFPILDERITGEITLDTNKISTHLVVRADTVFVSIPVEKVMPCNRKHQPEDFAKKQRSLRWTFYLLGAGSVILINIILKFITKKYNPVL